MKIGLILPGAQDPPLPSTRVALLNVLPHLRLAGLAPVVLHAPDLPSETPTLQLNADAIAASNIGIVIFQKVYGGSAVALAQALEVRNVRTVFLVCDRVVADMAAATSATVCVTSYLASLYPEELSAKMHVVHDGIERPDRVKTQWRDDRGSALNPLRAVLVTSARLDQIPVLGTPPPWLHIDIVGNYPPTNEWTNRLREQWRAWQQQPHRRRQQLQLALSPRVSLQAWHPDGVYDTLVQADIGIIPIDRSPPVRADHPPPAWIVKSENRLTLKMSVGLPVIATPIPAYKPVVSTGRNAYLASTRDDWLDALTRLRDPAHRATMGSAARQSVAQSFSIQRQAERILGVLRQLKPDRLTV